jgi:hypothetical protein
MLDHVFDLERVLAKSFRLLRGGPVHCRYRTGLRGRLHPGEFEATHWRNRQALVARLTAITRFALENPDELDKHDRWAEVVLRKPYADD